MIDFLIDKLINLYAKFELRKIEKKQKKYKKNIIPNYVKNRRIQIYNNNSIVFDNNNVKEIPEGIQYAIKSYGIPTNIKPNNKTPLVYKINTTLSSMFPSEEIEKKCIDSMSKING